MPKKSFAPRGTLAPFHRHPLVLPDKGAEQGVRDPGRSEQFERLTDTEESLWIPLQQHLAECGGFDVRDGLIDSLSKLLEPHGARGKREVVELVNHLVSAGRLTKRSRKGVVVGVGFPQNDEQLDAMFV